MHPTHSPREDCLRIIRDRRSVRAFLDRPVPRETVERILEAARWAPSGVNTQPWEVCVVQGETRERISAAMLAARAAEQPPRPDYHYYPEEWVEPWLGRRRACGLALYGALGIGRRDKARRLEAWNANYRFFGAPVGLFFFMDRRLQQGSWLDMGMFIENVMLAARALGLGTCPQASLAEYPDIVRRELGIADDRLLLCGMALGHPDPEAAVNRYRTEREPVASFSRWYD